MNRTIFVSDLHAGHPVAREPELVACLERERWDRLVVAGDFRDTAAGCSAAGWRLLERMARWHRQGREVVFLPGNHDPNTRDVASALGVTYRVAWLSDCGTVCACHGHVDPFLPHLPWDRWLTDYPQPTAVMNQLEGSFAFWGGRPGTAVAKGLHRCRRRLFDVRKSVKAGALDLATRMDYQWVIAGHTHYAEFLPRTTTNRGYCNLGSWCQGDAPTYAVMQDGNVWLEEWKG